MKQKIQALAIAALAILMSACGTTSFATKGMSNADFMAASPEVRSAYLKALDEERQEVTAKERVEFLAGRPIYRGDEKTGYTLQWDSSTKLLYVYPGHKPAGMGLESYAAMSLVTDGEGNVLYGNDGVPRKMFVGYNTQEDLTRQVLKTLAGMGPAAVNGALAAKIATDGACKDCGGPAVVNMVQGGSAAAMNRNELSAGAAGGVEMTGGCSSNRGGRW